VNLVEVYATVSNRQGEPVAGLTAADFAVAEDGVPQSIAAFAAGDLSLAVAIGIDRSFSMGGKANRLGLARSGARTLVGVLRRDDRVMVPAIGSETSIVARLDGDRETALSAIDRLDAWGTTPLYDATLGALDAIQPARGRRALVLLSDGHDRYSTTAAADLIDRARRHDVLIYPIAIGAGRPAVFAELAVATGGRSFVATDENAVNAAVTAVENELRLQYLLGYVPARERVGTPSWRAIEVTVRRPDLRVRAREGYAGR
jgi:Ca-activated chloride channel family protein